MSIVSAELVWRRSAESSDAGTNGGRMTSTVSTSAVKNNLFPDVPQAERTAGSTKYRKAFIHVANDDDLTLVSPRVFVESRTPGDDVVTIFFSTATQNSTQASITGSEQQYGAGLLNASVLSGVGTIVVAVEDWTNAPIFANGMKIRISDRANINGAGNEEYHTISTHSAAGNLITLNLVGTLANGYSASSKVASVYEPGDIACAISGVSNGTSGGFASANIVMDNIGTVYDVWTITFTTPAGAGLATNYTVAGASTGALAGTGAIGSSFSPSNPSYSKPYFTIPPSVWTTGYTAGQTATFTTSPAAIPVWYKRRIPAGASSLSGNSVIVAVDGESS